MKVAAETLSQIDIFRDLDIDARRRLAERLSMRRLDARKQIITQKDESTNVYFVISGEVRATLFSSSGKEVDFQDLGPGQMFGELSAIDGERRSTHVVTLAESVIASMSRDAFWSALDTFPSVNRRTLVRLTGLIRMHCDRIFEYGTLGVKNRIHAELLRVAREVSDGESPVEIANPPTHAEIANRVATHREAVTRECKHLESLGVIDWRPGRHVVNDMPALERLVQEVKGH